MKKNKKTRQEKKIADLHRKLQLQNQSASLPSYSFVHPKKELNSPIIHTTTIAKNIHPQLLSDLLKTITLTGIIVFLEGLLSLALKKHIIALPNISF